jgi:proteasome accessory factor C
MVPWLLDHPGATIAELATRFDSDPDEILEDLDVLGYCGLPGYGGGDLIEVRLFGDRVSVHMADYFRRPLRLTQREAVTLLLAARAFADVAQVDEAGPLARAAAKLEDLLGTEAEPRQGGLAVELAASPPPHLAELRAAVDSGAVVRLVYRSESKAETTTREVEPWKLTLSAGQWYLQGWCRLADGPRAFRVDRVREAVATGEVIEPAEATPGPPVYRPGPDDRQVVVDVTPEGRWITDWIVVDTVERRGRRWRITFRTTTLDWAARLVMRLAGHATVVRPDELAGRVRALAGATLAAYEED